MTCREKYNPVQRAYDLMVGFVHENKTTNLEEVIGYLGEALDDQADTIEAKFTLAMPVEESNYPAIKDSGDRTEFDTGAVRDMREGKGRCDLMPLEVVANMCAEDTDFDNVLLNIRYFQKTKHTSYLYNALEFFNERHWDNCYTMLLEVSKHFEEGAKKYGENNWQKGIPVKCYIDSAVRHYLKWLRGDNDEPHDRAFVWNLMCCIWEADYRPKDAHEFLKKEFNIPKEET